MGRTGAGKTTLVNALCGTRHESGAGKGSVTRNLFRNDVGNGENAFSLIDTPGTDSSIETYKHAFLLREALTATKMNTIFIVIKYDSRFDKMIDNYFELEQPVYNYGNKIIVMISHWDQSKEPEKDFREICELFQDECTNINNIIFYSEQSSKIEVANLMYTCISNMEEEKLEIKDEDFFLQFNICQMKSQMKVSLTHYQKKANLLSQEYTELINSVKSESVEDKDEVLHMTIVQFKNEMETLLQEFRLQHGGAMAELDYYTFYIKMEKENVRICDEFVEKVVPLMSYNLFDNQDPRNLIKKCPYCGLIWFKTEGCDGTTTCGNNKFDSYYDVSSKAFWKYHLQRTDGKLQWTKNPMKKNILEESTRDGKETLIRSVQWVSTIIKECSDDANSKRVGCGKEFKWSQLPKVDDDLILELFKVKTIDQAKQLIQAGNFRDVKQNYEFCIDSTFYF
ncbi:unnamed protein product [Rotaria sp. Silwood1]|nr:unnamed protein product [Rotaria sp. Silwood1]CAF1642305.1 unnamed protein product [Rotaria sp. Silwood1]